MASVPQPQDVFKRLKPVCVPLMGSSLLTPASISSVSKLLTDLINVLRDVKSSNLLLTSSLISYTFFPLSTILRRNNSLEIPDQVLEKIFIVLAILCDDWWWTCDLAIFEQIFMLCGSVIGSMQIKGKTKSRDDETKQAAAQCLFSLLRPRGVDEAESHDAINSQSRLNEVQDYLRADKFLPIFGQTLNHLLIASESRRLDLQRTSLDVIYVMIDIHAPDDLVPSVLPGLVSTMVKVCHGSAKGKGWANSEIVLRALNVLRSIIIKAIGNDVCIREGAIHRVVDLEDLAPTDEPTVSHDIKPRSFATRRTPVWLRGTSSQVLIALNSLTPLISHPTPTALHALSSFSFKVLKATSLTLPQIQPLLLSFLLSLSNSVFLTVSDEAHTFLLQLMQEPPDTSAPLLRVLLQSTRDYLSALPSLLLSHSESKVDHIAGLIEAVCRLAVPQDSGAMHTRAIKTGLGKLLGPSGGIEKWGWGLLSVLELNEPSVVESQIDSARLILDDSQMSTQSTAFPEMQLKHASSSTTRNGLERMFRALGQASGDSCLFSVEWFYKVGQTGTGTRAVSSLWCACRLLEGVSGICLSRPAAEDIRRRPRSKRLSKLAGSLSKSTSELWDGLPSENTDEGLETDVSEQEADVSVRFITGIPAVPENLRLIRGYAANNRRISKSQPILRRALCLQLLAISAGVLETRFSSLLIYTLYPILHSIVSPIIYLSATAHATLDFVTVATSFASPSNLLLSNFDYALDSVSRRLTRRWLDVDATKVLSLLVRLVGSDIVDRAGDVVEECFDRLDEYHGYGVVVEGLVGVLGEVIQVIGENSAIQPAKPPPELQLPEKKRSLDDLFQWMSQRYSKSPEWNGDTDYGPAPREAWGKQEPTEENPPADGAPDSNEEPPATPIQALTKQIVARSLYFLTHDLPIIRARILSLLTSAVPVLPESALLPSVHTAWPFILNRLDDPEPFVVSAAAALIETLATNVGSFMYRRIWDDAWPKLHVMLDKLHTADSTRAVMRSRYSTVGAQTAYTTSHRIHKSILKTMISTAKGVHPHESSVWQMLLDFRRFLHIETHEELQSYARELYQTVGAVNPDPVWLVLTSSLKSSPFPSMVFLQASQWDIEANVKLVLANLDT